MKLDLSMYESFGDAFEDRLPKHGKDVALIEVNRDEESARYTYKELRQEAKRVAVLLQQLGLKPGDHCAIVMSNQSKWVISGIAVYLCGGVIVPIDYKLSSEEHASYFRHCDPKIIVTEWGIREKWLADKTEIKSRVKILVTEAPEDKKEIRGHRWEAIVKGSPKPAKRTRDDVCAILYSSGTGGRIKGCMMTHANYLKQVENFSLRVQMKRGDRYLSILPTNHGIDFVFGFLLPMILGATVVHQRTLRPQYLTSTLKDYQIDITTFVPLILKEIQKKIQSQIDSLTPVKKTVVHALQALHRAATPRPRHWLSKRVFQKVHEAFGGRLRLIMTGGTFIDSKLVRFFYNFGIFVGIGYGLTEAGTTVSTPVWEQFHDDNVGKLLPDTEVQIRNPDASGVGEIWVRSPCVMKGYYKDPDLTREYLQDGWLRTDDLGTLDAKGFLRIKGRKKNIIVTPGGENIYPEDVETAFEDLRELKEYCVFGTHYLWPDTPLLEEKLFLVAHPQDEVDITELPERIRARNRSLAEQKRISGFLLWTEDFPRTGSLKLKREFLAKHITSNKKPVDIQRLL
ncbi:MAG: AMP-binding protein [Deltaproteobacteria bacterium]|nr:AMP-binding protein [Deltaproteobacteria bacterium]